jgi:YHS domain-containing protein
VVDPVCGKEMPKEDALATSSHRGQTRYFCSDACKASFLEEPEAYS